MIRKLLALVFILSCFIIGCKENRDKFHHESYQVRDDLGINIEFNSPPVKIISLAPNITEIIYSLQLENRLKGNTLYCNFPEDARKKPKVGDLLSVDYEKILSIKPDLILITVEGNLKENYEKLKKLGFKLFVSNPRNYAGIKKTMKDFSRIFRMEDKADSIILKWDQEFSELKQNVKAYPDKTCIFFIGLNPIMAAGKNTFINELITSAGLENAVADSKFNYPVLSREQIIKRNPDYIILTKDLGENEKELVGLYPEWKKINAIRSKNVLAVDPDMYSRPGPRFIEALKDLFFSLHPEEKDSLIHREAVRAGNH